MRRWGAHRLPPVLASLVFLVVPFLGLTGCSSEPSRITLVAEDGGADTFKEEAQPLQILSVDERAAGNAVVTVDATVKQVGTYDEKTKALPLLVAVPEEGTLVISAPARVEITPGQRARVWGTVSATGEAAAAAAPWEGVDLVLAARYMDLLTGKDAVVPDCCE